MNKTAKALLIPVAAFAVTVTGVSAFNSDVLEKAGLNTEQVEAFERARDLRKDGDRDGAREVIMNAGIDMETMHSVREAMHEHRHEMHSAIDTAVEAGDYDAFKEAVKGSPLDDIVTSEDDFQRFAEAHNLRKEGDREAAREIMEDLGFEDRDGHIDNMEDHGMREGVHGEHRGDFHRDLDD